MTIISASLLVLAAAAPAPAPLWELGFGVAPLYLADYHGSNEYRGYLLPLPYAVYRGEKLKMDDAGLFAKLFEGEWVKLDVSGGAGLPVNSKRNAARKGMSGLDATVELGPLLTVNLWKGEDQTVSLNAPLRQVWALSPPKPTARGVVFGPYARWEILRSGEAGSGDYWTIYAVLSPQRNTERYNRYYYDVPASNATPERPAYDASAGYGGTRATLTFKRHSGQTFLAGFVQYESLRGAVFANSPLVKTDKYFASGMSAVWILAKENDPP
jgi:outer membrane scaffolding protein for murein synthesis (MipA/OmpV family)